MIHPSAIVDSEARLADGVSVGAFSIIGAGVEVGEGTRIDSHVVLEGPTRIGRDNRFHAFSVIGGAPQDKKYAGEPTTLTIGNGNTFREHVTISRGTVQDAGVTTIGDDNWIMAAVHIAHDCRIGSHIVMANNATLAGHVVVDDWAIIGGLTGIHQYCRIGAHAFVGMGCQINGDVPPFVMVAGHYARPRGINSEGLKRRGFAPHSVSAIKRAYRALYVSGRPLAEALQQMHEAASDSAEVADMLKFIENSDRSLLR
jgi:UDP-N-acetylglucosamine acyltransferase